MQVFTIKRCKGFRYRAQFALPADRLNNYEEKGNKTKAGTLSDSRSYLVL